MFRHKSLAGFTWRFLLIFGVLAAPWPGSREMYGHSLLSLARTALATEDGRRELTFETVRDPQNGEVDARVAIVNRDLMNEEGAGPVRNFDIALGVLGAQSTALLL